MLSAARFDKQLLFLAACLLYFLLLCYIIYCLFDVLSLLCACKYISKYTSKF